LYGLAVLVEAASDIFLTAHLHDLVTRHLDCHISTAFELVVVVVFVAALVDDDVLIITTSKDTYAVMTVVVVV